MIQCKCTKIIKDTKGSITKFELTDTNGYIREVNPNQLKQAIKEGKVNVVNLQLKQDKPVNKPANKSKLSDKEKIKTYIKNAKAFGFKVTEFPSVASGRTKCFIISKSDVDHIMYIPDNVTEVSNIDNKKRTRQLANLKGKLKVIGGDSLLNTSSMFEYCKLECLDLSSLNT